jgi:hypothetical protein
MTTYASFIAGLATLDVAGVKRVFDYPPAALNTADLPTMWVQLPWGESGALTFQVNDGWPTLRAQIIIAAEAVGQERQSVNYAAVVTLMDNLSAALAGADVLRGPLSWTVRQGIVEVAGAQFWSVIADVEGRG